MTDTQPATAVQAGFRCVAGRCPSCQGSSLFLAEGGHVTCSRLDCPNPARADDLLHGGTPEHVADTARRREWAAAYRSVAEGLATEGYGELHGMITGLADAIEDGVLTPWADQPESADDCGEDCTRHATCRPPAEPSAAAPAAADPGQWTVLETDSQGERVEPSGLVFDNLTEARAHAAEMDADHAARGEGGRYRVYRLVEAQPSGAAPAAAGPHPDTPAVLGRALLHQTVDGHPQLWAERDGLWHTHIASGPRTRVYIESAERYVGPVLLVSPAGGRVLDAARATVQAWRHPTVVGQVADAEEAQVAAVDALDGDQPAEPAPKRSRARLVADPIHTCVTPRGRREDCTGCSAEAAELAIESDTPTPETEAEIDAGMAEFAALPDCDYCGGTGKQVPPGWYERRRDAERRAAEIIQPAVDALTPEQFDALVAASRPEPAPEPDSGPGWDRARIELIADAIEKSVRLNCECWHSADTAGQLRALLADRDQIAAERLREHNRAEHAEHERETARAELAQQRPRVTGEASDGPQ